MSDPGGEESVVLCERRDSVLVLTLNRPARLNAWTRELEELYFKLLADADGDPKVRAIVVTGAGAGFCAGGDIAELSDEASGGRGRRLGTPACRSRCRFASR